MVTMPRILVPLLALTVAVSCGRASLPSSVPMPGPEPREHAVASASAMTPCDEDVGAFEGKFDDGRKVFDDVKTQLLQRYVSNDLSEDDLYRAAVEGMLQYADLKRRKWNKLLSPAELAELHADLEGRITGIGVKIDHFDPATGYTTVVGAIPGSAAERAGIMANDIIVTVDGKLYKGKTLRDIVRAVRGKEGERVTLTLLRDDRLVTVSIKREVIEYDNVEHRQFAGGIGYVSVRSFTSKTPEQLAAALNDLSAKGARGLVLDLRQNQGGAFEQAVASAGLLTPQGAEIVRLVKREGKEEVYTSKASGPRVLGDIPLMVLVDHDTSSGAELVAAALRDNRHAQLLGTHTFGKWSVQTVEDLPNGYAAKFTIGLFKSPSGQSYEGTGLTPDVEVDMDSAAVEKACAERDPEKELSLDTQLRTAVNLLALRVR